MSRAEQAERALHAGDVRGALAALQEKVREAPADRELRRFLAQLYLVAGEWERALNALDTLGQVDAEAMPMVQTYRTAVECEQVRARVFAGRTSPLLLGEPEPWIALAIEALLREGRGEAEAGAHLRAQAWEQAPETPGTVDGTPFDSIADGDSRLGPVLEAIVQGKYFWIPFDRIARIDMETPSDLRDKVFMPATLLLRTEGEVVALLPARYPGSVEAGRNELLLGKVTEWSEPRAGIWLGLGQKMLVTGEAEYALMDVRSLVLGTTGAVEAQGDG